MSAVFPPIPQQPLERRIVRLLEEKWQPQCPPVQSCGCIGPQNGQPVCPCQMAGVTIENGRYVRRVDLGPAP